MLPKKKFSKQQIVDAANGSLPEDFNEEKGVELLDSTAVDVITAARLRKKADLQ